MKINEWLLVLSFLFFIGSSIGWCLEVVYRRFFEERRWMNPGFLTGPYLPLYGFSLCSVYLMAHINITFIENKYVQKIVLFVLMSVIVTIIEYIAGMIFIRHMKIKLWDYTDNWGNVKGIICPKFSFYWVVLSAIYYFLIHPLILDVLKWLAKHPAFSFVIGFFYGVFVVDLCYSMNIMSKIREFATNNKLVIKYEELKESIRRINEENGSKVSFIFAMRSELSLTENLKRYLERGQDKLGNIKKKVTSRGEK